MYRELVALTRRELIKWLRTPSALFSSIITPVMYLALFGQAFNLARLFPPGPVGQAQLKGAILGAPDYFSYFAVGMVGFVALFACLFVGANVIFDKRLGLIKKVTVAPIPRSAIFGARLIAGALRPIVFGLLVLAVALAFAHVGGLNGLTISGSVSAVGALEIVLSLFLVAMSFTAIFLSMGFLLDSPEAYFGVINLLNLPILFTSNALFPQKTMPGWLQLVSAVNPVSLSVNVMRENLFSTASYYPHSALVYLGGLALWTLALGVVAFLIARRGLRTA